MRRLKLLIARALVLGLGLLSAWLIAFVIFDFADKRLPTFLALAVTYGLGAYVVLPRAVRTGAHLLKRGRVPTYTLTGDGLPGDPVNVAFVGAFGDLRAAFTKAGWREADALSFKSSLLMVQSFLMNRPYPTAPFSTLYLFDRAQDVGFQLPIGDSPRKRHHVRFWGLSVAEALALRDQPEFWRPSQRPGENEAALWVGAATRDTGIALTRLTFKITHATDSDTDEERDFLVGALASAGAIENLRSHRPGERVAIGRVNHYRLDGFVAVADLQGALPS